MEQNKNVNELEYISVENLELLYDNIRKFFTDIHKVDILNYNVKIKEILFENMKLIYGTKHAASLKTKELNIITLKNIKNILEEEINNSGIKNSQDNQYIQPNNPNNIPNNIPNNNLDNQYTERSNKLNVDIINRENNVYDRRNEDNKILMQPSNNGSFNTEQNKNFSNQYDNLLSERSNALPKREEINFNTQVISSESPDKMNKNMEQLLAEREQLLNKDNNTENSTSQQSLPQQSLPQQSLSSTPIDTSNNNSNLELNLEGFTNDDDNFGTLYEETEKLLKNPSDITPQQQLNEYKPENIDIENVNVNDFNYIPTQIPQELPQELPQENRVVIRKQIIVLNSSKRDLEQYPNPYNYTIDLKIPIQNIVSIKLLNVLININKVKNNINYLLLNLNDFNILTSNHENINEKFAIVFENKIYNEEIIFDEPLESLDKFTITFTDKNDKIPDSKDSKHSKDSKNSKSTLKKNDNIIELFIEYF